MHKIVVIFKAKHTNVKPLTELQLHNKDSEKPTPASVAAAPARVARRSKAHHGDPHIKK